MAPFPHSGPISTVAFAPRAGRALAALVLAALLLFPSWAQAQWQPERIAEVKAAAEKAYENGDYAEAARHYIELSGILRAALEKGEVPESYLNSAQSALVVCSYQLGRSNQLSANCHGAVKVYSELIDEGYAPPEILDKSHYRLAESHLCLANQALEGLDFATFYGELEASQSPLIELLAKSSEDEGLVLDEGLREEIEATRLAITALQSAGRQAHVDELEGAISEGRCGAAERLLEASEPLDPAWVQEMRQRYQSRCVNSVHTPAPEPAASEGGLSPWPWVVIGVGAVAISGAIYYDIDLADDIDSYEANRQACLDEGRACDEASRQRDELEGRPELAMGFYIASGTVIAAGLGWLIYDLTAQPEASSSIALWPSPHGLAASWLLSF